MGSLAGQASTMRRVWPKSAAGRTNRHAEGEGRTENRSGSDRRDGAAAAIERDGSADTAAGGRARHAGGGGDDGVRTGADTGARRGAERSAGVLRRSARTSAASNAGGSARAGARRSRHRRGTKCAGHEPRRSPRPAQPGQGEEARRWDSQGDWTLHHGVGRHAAVSEASRRASVSAQRAQLAEARGIAAEIDRREIAA